MTKNKTTHGGARKGAGRKPSSGNPKSAVLNIRCTPEELAAIRSAAENAGKTISAYVLSAVLK